MMQLVMHQMQCLNTCMFPQRVFSVLFIFNHFAFQSKNFPSDVKEATAEIKSETKKATGYVFLFQV